MKSVWHVYGDSHDSAFMAQLGKAAPCALLNLPANPQGRISCPLSRFLPTMDSWNIPHAALHGGYVSACPISQAPPGWMVTYLRPTCPGLRVKLSQSLGN